MRCNDRPHCCFSCKEKDCKCAEPESDDEKEFRLYGYNQPLGSSEERMRRYKREWARKYYQAKRTAVAGEQP